LDRHQLALWRGRVSAEFAADNLTRAYRDVLFTLADFHTCKEGIFPAHATLAERANASVPTVRRALAMGRRLGLVDWDAQWVRQGWRMLRTTNRYILLLPATPIEAGLRPKQPTRITDQNAGGAENKKDSKEVAHRRALAQLMREAATAPDLLLQRQQALPGILLAARRQRLSESRLC
jgi:hypothetical protein